MAINTNDGTGLKDLPAIPQIPDNVGKLDVKGIYDRVVQGLTAQTDLGTNLAGQQATQSILANQTAQNDAQRSLVPSNTAASLATNAGTVAQTPLRTASLATTVGAQEATTPSEITKAVSGNDLATLNNDVSKIYAEAGLKYAPEIADDTSQLQQGLVKRLKDSGTGMVTSPLTGPSGQPLGSLIAYVGPDGQPRTQVVPVPFGQLSKINTGIQYTPIGPKIDPSTNQPVGMQWQTLYPNAAGGITKGEIVTTGINDGPPGQLYGPSQAQPQGVAPSPQGAAAPAPGSAPQAPAATPTAAAPAVGGRIGAQVQAEQEKTIQKQRTDRLAELTAVKSANDQLANAITQTAGDVAKEQNSALGSGPVVGHITVGRPEVQQVQQDIGRFATQIMSTVKNIRNVNEFNAVTANVPRPTDYPAVQNEKIAYLKQLSDVISKRADLESQLLHDNPHMDVNTADKIVTDKIPFNTAGPVTQQQGAAPASTQQAAPAPQGTAVGSGPPAVAVAFLKSNPSLSAQFDQKYGQGASAAALGGPPAQ